MTAFWTPDAYFEAYKFAAVAHRGHILPGTDLPYLVHLSQVSSELIAALRFEEGRNENLAVRCALLHDVIEHTKTTYEEVKEIFGTEVANGVLALTKDEKLQAHLQMEDCLRRIREQPREIWMVKLADRISNLNPPPSFWTNEEIILYREEAIRIHSALQAGSRVLAERLLKRIEAYPPSRPHVAITEVMQIKV